MAAIKAAGGRVCFDPNLRPEVWGNPAEMVYGTTLTLPAQLAASQERPVEDILRALNSAEPNSSVETVPLGGAC